MTSSVEFHVRIEPCPRCGGGAMFDDNRDVDGVTAEVAPCLICNTLVVRKSPRPTRPNDSTTKGNDR